MNSLDSIYAQDLQKGWATRDILLNPNDIRAKENYTNVDGSMRKSFQEASSMANTQEKGSLKILKTY